MKILDKSIGWIVVLSIGFIGPFDIFQGLVRILYGEANFLFNLLRFLLVLLLLIYQKTHYGIKIWSKPFLYFFVLYSFYILVDITFLQDNLLRYGGKESLPSLSNFLIKTSFIVFFFFCIDTIIKNFNSSKFIILSAMFTIIPSLIYIQFVGIEVLQFSKVDKDATDYLAVLTIGYSCAPILVFLILNFSSLFKPKWLNWIVNPFFILTAGYVILACGERGPILWFFVNVMLCFYLKTKEKIKFITIIFLSLLVLYILIDIIIEQLLTIAPYTAQKIYMTVHEGYTAGRFDPNDPSGTTYGCAWNQFMSSPIWGSYFRILREFSYRYFGAYPHNLFLEILITMGLLGFTPFLTFLYKTFKNASTILQSKENANYRACVILFFSSFLELLTSGTLLLNTGFWLFFYIVNSYDKICLYYSNTNLIKTKNITRVS
ncbi:MAG: O-antigen ligase family protein [Clostridia bacterium]|nr:O-antigen ligase family protein [Clostridia bacterium]